ncbi:MAG: helix-turn-helix domain-containing protein [Beijerinckiaceae bacterium]|nr:helix-turn-helix domain-containing protein [Beijerinckiaceae bacterium]
MTAPMKDRAKGDDFNRRKLEWLSQVLRDHSLPRIALHVAVALGDYFNRGNMEAWPSQSKLATDCGLSRNGVRKGIKALEAGDHLAVVPGQGLGNSSRYKWNLKGHGGCPFNAEKGPQPLPFSETKRATAVNEKGHSGVHERATAVATNLMNEPIEEPVEYISLKDDDLFGEKKHQEALTKSPPRKSKPDAPDGFEEFYAAYPRRVEPDDARTAYDRVIRKGKATAEELLAGAIRYASERDGQERKFTKHPATWLNKGCWADEPAPAAAPYSNGLRHEPAMSTTERLLRRVHERQHAQQEDL